MNEWLNSPAETLRRKSPRSTEGSPGGVPSIYKRNNNNTPAHLRRNTATNATPQRPRSGSESNPSETGSAKKRWLRQAISEETSAGTESPVKAETNETHSGPEGKLKL